MSASRARARRHDNNGLRAMDRAWLAYSKAPRGSVERSKAFDWWLDVPYLYWPNMQPDNAEATK